MSANVYTPKDFPPGVPTHTSIVHNQDDKNLKLDPIEIHGQGDFINRPTTTFNFTSSSLIGEISVSHKKDYVVVNPVVEFSKEQDYGPGSSDLHYTFMGHLNIRNTCTAGTESSQTLFFKVKTTAPEKFAVNQILGIIPPSTTINSKIVVRPDTVLWTISRERFLVLVMKAPPDLLAQKILLSKLINRNNQGGCMNNKLSTKLHKMWNDYVAQGIQVESHRVNCLLSTKYLDMNDYCNGDPASNIDCSDPQGPRLKETVYHEELLTPTMPQSPPGEMATNSSKNEECVSQNSLESQGQNDVEVTRKEPINKHVYDNYKEKLGSSCSCDAFLNKIKSVEGRIDNLKYKTALQFCSLKRTTFICIVLLIILALCGYLTIIRQAIMETEAVTTKIEKESYIGCNDGEPFLSNREVNVNMKQEQECRKPPIAKQYATWNYYV